MACVYFQNLTDLLQRKTKPTIETKSSKKQACWWQVRLRARWIPVSQTWMTGRTTSWSSPVVLQDGLLIHRCAWLECTIIIVSPASLFCPMDACMWLLMCLRAETLLSCLAKPIDEVAPMSTSCLTLEKTSPSNTDSIARSSGCGAVFLRREILMYNPSQGLLGVELYS